MNKILNINLGGYPLTIDEDAFEYLEMYLGSIRRRFSESDGRDEILNDIESRIGELIAQNMGRRSIVMLPDVEAAVQIMGKPEDFGADPIDNRRSMGSSRSNAGRTVKTGKRLFRDEEDASVGGVCSGLAAYFGIHDPLWMRLIFVGLFFISAGFWVPVYVLLWIMVPPAKTAADRLAMRGEPVNVDNIAREIEDGFDRLGKKVNEFGETAKKKSGSFNSGERSFGSALASGVSVLGKIFGFFLQFIAKFGWLVALLVGFALFLGLVISWAAGIWTAFSWTPYLEYFSPLGTPSTYMWLVNLFLVVSIPIVGLFLLLVRAIFKFRSPTWLSLALSIAWGVNLFSLITYSMIGAQQFKTGETVTKTMDLTDSGSDTIRFVGTGHTAKGFYFDGEDWESPAQWQNGKLAVQVPLDIRVRKSKDGQFRLVQVTSARGKSQTNALMNASQVEFDIQKLGNTVHIPRSILLDKGQKWHNQRIKIYVEVPVGKHIVFDDNIYHKAAADLDEYAKGNKKYYISRTPNRVFKMTSSGLACIECGGNWENDDFDSDTNYEDFILDGNFNTEIRKGDDFSINVLGNSGNQTKIRTIGSGRQLTLTTEGKTLETNVKVVITTPTFTNLVVKNAKEITVSGFDEGRTSIVLKSDAVVRGYFDSNDLDVTIDGNGKVELTGRGNELNVVLTENAKLDATTYSVERANISARGNSVARLNVKDHYTSKIDGSASVTVEGKGKKIE